MNLELFEQDIMHEIRNNDVYIIKDYDMKKLKISTTILNPRKHTNGHYHDNIEEVYYCLKGKGFILLTGEPQVFNKGDIITIPAGEHHRVLNLSRTKKLKFLCVMNKYKR